MTHSIGTTTRLITIVGATVPIGVPTGVGTGIGTTPTTIATGVGILIGTMDGAATITPHGITITITPITTTGMTTAVAADTTTVVTMTSATTWPVCVMAAEQPPRYSIVRKVEVKSPTTPAMCRAVPVSESPIAMQIAVQPHHAPPAT